MNNISNELWENVKLYSETGKDEQLMSNLSNEPCKETTDANWNTYLWDFLQNS